MELEVNLKRLASGGRTCEMEVGRGRRLLWMREAGLSQGSVIGAREDRSERARACPPHVHSCPASWVLLMSIPSVPRVAQVSWMPTAVG